MKIKTIALLISCFALMAFTAADVLSQLNTTEADANKSFFNAITNNNTSFNTTVVKAARSLPDEVQADCARQLVKLAKTYTQSDAFAQAYKKYRRERVIGKVKGFHIPRASDLLGKAADQVLSGNSADKNEPPANPNELIKKRLEDFMQLSATVDFNAKINGYMFVDAQNEQKSGQWKMCYRAGKPVIDAMRAEVQIWLDELK